MFQAEIDATNQMYAEKLRQAKLTGANRVGSGTAIQARRGLLGSDFGGAITDNINTDNNQIYSGIQAENNAAIAAIMGHARQAAVDEIKAKREATEKGLDAKLEYLKGAGERKTDAVKNAAQFLLDQGYDPKNISDADFKTIISKYPGNLTADEIKAQYKTLKTAKEAADLEKAQKGEFNLSEGQARYDANGKIIAQRAKTYKDTGSGGYAGGNFSPAAIAWAKQIQNGQATFANVPSSIRNEVAQALQSPTLSASKEADLRSSSKLVDDLLNNKALGRITGPVDQAIGGVFGKAALAKNQYNQLTALLSLENRSKLKGSGSISDFEAGQLAQAASALGRNLSEEDFKAQLNKVKTIFDSALLRANAEAQAPEVPYTNTVTAPDGLEVEIVD